VQNRKKLILVVCGSGIATSTVVLTAIKEELAKRGIEAEVSQTDVFSLPGIVKRASIIVSICSLSAKDFDIPVINGVPILTGHGKDRVIAEIIQKLKEGSVS